VYSWYNKNYDKDWALQYRATCIMSGHTDVRDKRINTMDRVSTILKHRLDTRPHNVQTNRGRSRGGRMRGNARNSYDVRGGYNPGPSVNSVRYRIDRLYVHFRNNISLSDHCLYYLVFTYSICYIDNTMWTKINKYRSPTRCLINRALWQYI